MPCPCCNAEVVCERNCPSNNPQDPVPAIPTVSEKGLVWLEFSSCIGSGAAGTVEAPHAVSPCDYKGLAGPITGVTLTNKGSGYARLGRLEPTVSASAAGTGATFTVTLEQNNEPLGKGCLAIPYWKVASVSVSSEGSSGYEDGASVSFTVADGDTEEVPAEATLAFDRIEPDVTMDGAATATVTLVQTAAPPVAEWSVDSVSVTSGGSGYSDGDPITFSTADTEISPATGTALVLYAEPANATLTVNTQNGSGAVLVPVWDLLPEEVWPAPNVRLYSLASVTVTNGGSDYEDNDTISISFTSVEDGEQLFGAQIDCGIVLAGGVIEEVAVSDPGEYVGSITDELESVVITDGGAYYKATSEDMTVTVTNGGKYYREDANEPPLVDDVTVTVQQEAPSGGTGAEITATVEDDTSSPDFGKLSALTLVNGGTGYLKPDLTCEVPDTIYIEWGDVSTTLTLRTPGQLTMPIGDGTQFVTGPGPFLIVTPGNFTNYPAIIPLPAPDFGYGYPVGIYPQICGDWDCSQEADAPLNDWFASKEIHGLFLWRYPAVHNLMVVPNDPARCLCGYVTLSFDLLWACGRCYRDENGKVPRAYQTQLFTVCVRFLTDETGCPIGDAVVTQWTDPTSGGVDPNAFSGVPPEGDTEFVCDKTCFTAGPTPQISFMP